MNQEDRPIFAGSIPENYERYLVPLIFSDYGADLASRPDLAVGGAVLETACGTGAVTRQLQARLPADCQLTVTDFAPPMVEQARAVVGDHPNIAYRQADATDLPFQDDMFDAVVCQFSVMFFPDKLKGMREAARVLKPEGRFIFNVGDGFERNGFSHAVHQAVAQIYPDNPPRFLAIPYTYHDLSVIVAALQQAGFADVEIDVQPRESKAADPRQVAMGLVAGTPLANQVAERGSLSLEDATDAVADAIAQKFGSGPISAPMQAFQISAQLPSG